MFALIDPNPPNAKGLTRLKVLIAGLVTACLLVLSGGCRPRPEKQDVASPTEQGRSEFSDDEGTVTAAKRLFQNGRYEDALATAERALAVSPDDTELLRLITQLYAQVQQFQRAAETAETLAAVSPGESPQRLVEAFDWYLQCQNFPAAEKALRSAIKADPSQANAHRMLAQLLCAQGRRQESREPLLEVVRLQSASEIELCGLVDLSNPYPMVSYHLYRQGEKASLFLLGDARLVYANNGDLDAVIENTRRVTEAFPDCLAAHAFLGRVLVESGRRDEFKKWLRECPSGMSEQAEYWRAIGLDLQLNGEHRKAIRSYGEALQIDPTDRQVVRGLAECLENEDQSELAAALRQKLSALDWIFRIARFADAGRSEKISDLMMGLGRPLESIGWLVRSCQLDGSLDARREQIAERFEKVQKWEARRSPEDRQRQVFEQISGLKLSDWPLFDRNQTPESDSSTDPITEADEIRFVEVLPRGGVPPATPPAIAESENHIPYLRQTTGSGVAVVDFDLDGRLDIYEANAVGEPCRQTVGAENRLLHCRSAGTEYVDVASFALVDDAYFGQGVCIGDINQDGFPDVLVANFGANQIYLNRGDGTFSKGSIEEFGGQTWTSSIALADVSGDHLPDVIEIIYVDDPSAATKECPLGSDCTPQQLRPAADQVFYAQPDGSHRRVDSHAMASKPSYGLGVVVTDFDGQPGNEFFIANDADVNHFWSRVAKPEDAVDADRFVESGAVRGCAVGRNGMSQACMGIAAGDFNGDGKIDLHVTNFWQEPANLFVQTTAGVFSDEALKFGLHQSSLKSLGFGTQARDFDNDGWLDLAVLTGHVFGDPVGNTPFRMQPQILRGTSAGFNLQPSGQGGEYFSTPSLGRGLAAADLNRDGRVDLVSSHLDRPLALLDNETETAGSWIQFQLVGTRSERDAIGTRVEVKTRQRVIHQWRTSGDGYYCSNDSVLHFGLGDTEGSVAIEVFWPTGKSQRYEGLACNARYLIREDASEAFIQP